MPEVKKDPFGRVFELKQDLLQEDVAAWNRAYIQMPRAGVAEGRQAALQAAIVAKWVLSPAASVEKRVDLETGKETMVYLFDGVDVRKMKPAEVFYYGRLCDALFEEVTAVPDLKN